MLKRLKRNWDLLLLWVILDITCIVKDAPTWAFIVLALCVTVLSVLREYSFLLKRGPK